MSALVCRYQRIIPQLPLPSFAYVALLSGFAASSYDSCPCDVPQGYAHFRTTLRIQHSSAVLSQGDPRRPLWPCTFGDAFSKQGRHEFDRSPCESKLMIRNVC